MKIIIVGSGIAGLSTYLFLQKHLVRNAPDEYEVYIYESHVSRQNATEHHGNATVESLSESTAVVGGGLGVSPNGMQVLRDIDPAIHDAVVAQGFPCEHFTFKAARNNWTLFTIPTNDKRYGPEYCVASSRHGLHECLKAHIPEDKIVYKRVSGVDMNEQGKSVIHFADGSEDDIADLVIGADGIKSAVKKSIFGAENDTSLAPKFEFVSPFNTGPPLTTVSDLIGVGGFVKASIPEELQRDKSMVFTFGPTAFFGYSPHGPLSSNQVMWWSNYELSGPPSETRVDPDDIKEQLKKRHGKWPDPLVQQIIAKCDVDTIWPIWITPELPTWSEGGRILIGDAAHALNPTSGQGASQALEDAKVLSLLLAHFLPKARREGNIQDNVKQAGKLFYEIRNPRVTQIQRTARKSKAMKKEVGVVLEFMMYFFLAMIGKFPSIGKTRHWGYT